MARSPPLIMNSSCSRTVESYCYIRKLYNKTHNTIDITKETSEHATSAQSIQACRFLQRYFTESFAIQIVDFSVVFSSFLLLIVHRHLTYGKDLTVRTLTVTPSRKVCLFLRGTITRF